ncbi:MAG: tetratricopeptide repeat protein, partial [Bacteroidota bacterium]
TTATDVYALGVVLYELLAGQRPYDVAGLSPSEVERTICDTAPTRPSASVRPAEYEAGALAAQRLRGDLDTIVLKALAKEPGQRYASAAALADDLGRHLDGLPVTARPATAGYRARKFVERHRVGTAAAALVVLALVTGAGVALWQAGVAAAERDRAAAALVQVEGTLDFLEDTILMGNPTEGDPDAPLSTVLDSAAARVDREATSPQVAGAIHTSLAGVYNGRGLPARAEHHARRALATLPAGDVRRGWALDGLALALTGAGRPAEAEAYHQRAIALLREPGDEPQLAVALNNYGGTLGALGRVDSAEVAYRESVALRRTLGIETASTLNNLAVLLLERGETAQAVEAFSDMVAALRQDDNPGATYQLPFALVNRAGALSDLGRPEEATADFREAWTLAADHLGEDHPEAIAMRVSLVNHLNRVGRTDEAEQEGTAVLATAEAALEPGHPFLAYAQSVVGGAFCNAGDPQRGAALLEASLGSRRAMLPPEHWLLSNGESLLGGCLAQLGRAAEADRLLRGGYDGVRAALGDDHPRTDEARTRLADFLMANGRTSEAESLSEQG